MLSSYVTFNKVFTHYGMEKDWHLDGKYNVIYFDNGSRIDLLDVDTMPSDPLFERLGSLEYTGGWIEEAGEVNFLAFDVLKSRIGRHMNLDKNGEIVIPPKMLLTCNPNKGWLYRRVYSPWKKKTLPTEYAFIQALYSDNNYTINMARQTLGELSDQAMRERLMMGNWEYDTGDGSLMKYDYIIDLFTNNIQEEGEKYLVADIARFGSDYTVISRWKGLECYSIIKYKHKSVQQNIELIKSIAHEESIPYSHICVDEDGVGGGVVDGLPGIVGFVNNSSPMQRSGVEERKENYANLKTQCAYELGRYVTLHKMSVKIEDEQMKEEVVADLEQIKTPADDKEGKLRIRPKEEVKEVLGRSPDVGDNFIMRMVFEIAKSSVKPLTGNKRPSYI